MLLNLKIYYFLFWFSQWFAYFLFVLKQYRYFLKLETDDIFYLLDQVKHFKDTVVNDPCTSSKCKIT